MPDQPCRCERERGKRYDPCPLERPLGAIVRIPLAEESRLVEVCPEVVHPGFWEAWDQSRAWDALVEAVARQEAPDA